MNRLHTVFSTISPAVLITSATMFIALSLFLNRWEELILAAAIIVVSSVLGRTGIIFWLRYLKLSMPLVLLSVVFNWITFLPEGFSSFLNPKTLTQPGSLDLLWKALMIGARLSFAIFLSLFLVHICSHEELVWGVAKLSKKIFSKPQIGEVLALSLLSVPFFLENLSKVRKWRDIPQAIPEVFVKSQSITAHPVEIEAKKPGWFLLSLSVVSLVTVIIYR